MICFSLLLQGRIAEGHNEIISTPMSQSSLTVVYLSENTLKIIKDKKG